MTLIGIHFIEKYGAAIFIGTPFFIGFLTTLMYGQYSKEPVSKREYFCVGFLTLGVYAAGLLVFALEGIICILMAAPLAALGVWIGSLLALPFVSGNKRGGVSAMAISLVLYPSSFVLDGKITERLENRAVTSSVEIDATPEKVWSSVIGFTPIEEKPDLIFRLGVSYPTHAVLEGTGAGAIRRCHFSTGTFVEPITVWDPPNVLQFDVASQPDPMTELTLWKIHPPHLTGYFASQKGRFEITKDSNGKVLLTGTTWYTQKIFPIAYWSIWTDVIIHAIHMRVLNHIKNEIE